MLDMKREMMGQTYADWAWVIGGGLVAGTVGKIVGLRGLGLAVLGSIAGYYVRSWRTNGVPLQLQDLQARALAQAQRLAIANGNGNANGALPQHITGASADEFIVPDPSAAPAPGSEGALAGMMGTPSLYSQQPNLTSGFQPASFFKRI